MKSRCFVYVRFTWCESEARSGLGDDCVVAVDGPDEAHKPGARRPWYGVASGWAVGRDVRFVPLCRC